MPELYLLFLIVLVATALFIALHRRTTKRFIVTILAITASAYAFIIILPFFAYGLHLEDPAQVAGGSFDPKGYLLFGGGLEVGSWLHFVALLLLPITPFVFVALGLRLAIKLLRGWQEWKAASRAAVITVLMFSAALFAFMWTPIGRVILAWHFD